MTMGRLRAYSRPMVPVVSSLVLSNTQLLQTGAQWPDDVGFVIGPIFFVNETRLTFSGEEEAEEITPSHYEVWQVPLPFLNRMFAGEFDGVEEVLDDITELKCLRVWLSGNVAWAEERWPTMLAAEAISDRFKDMFNISSGSSEEAPEPNGQQPVASP